VATTAEVKRGLHVAESENLAFLPRLWPEAHARRFCGEVIGREVGVFLRNLDVVMAEQLLQGENVAA